MSRCEFSELLCLGFAKMFSLWVSLSSIFEKFWPSSLLDELLLCLFVCFVVVVFFNFLSSLLVKLQLYVCQKVWCHHIDLGYSVLFLFLFVHQFG